MDETTVVVIQRLVGRMTAAGIPRDEAVALVEELTASLLVNPTPPNPMYHGLPWLVPGPAAGAPYYE